MAGFKFEACVDSVYSALQAEKGGAARVELCSALTQGGLTPSYGLIKTVKEQLGIPIVVLVRPRSGDFCYSQDEIQVVCHDVGMAGELGVQGIAFGALTQDGDVQVEVMTMVMDLCRKYGLSITFHRAFDAVRDPFEALEVLVELRIPRILTSGQNSNVTHGMPILKMLVEKSAKRLTIMPGGGVNESNASEFVRILGINELHGSASSPLKATTSFLNPEIEFAMTGGHVQTATDLEKVARIVASCNAILLQHDTA